MAVCYKDLGLVNSREMFKKAMAGHYAIPAFNFNNMEQLQAIMKPSNFVGRAPQQVEEFLKEDVNPVLEANKEVLGMTAEINV